MSRSIKSDSRSRSRSRSRSHSRSRSRSRSTSHSRSRSRSRSRKRHYRSRSRSWSRSHSPSHNREKKYPREYQNGREFRGYHRGFRRPYNFRGRGRGYFPRGRYQRGGRGGGYNNNNFRQNWKNYKQYPQKQQQQQQQQNHSRGRSHNLQQRSGSPLRGHSHHSDRSSSPVSRHSQHSSSSSHSSSPKWRPALLLTNQNSKDVKEELSASKEVQKGGGGSEEPVELVGALAGEAKEGACGGKTEGNCQGLTDCSSSPKRTSPLASSAVIVGENSQTANQSSHSPKITNDVGNGASCWKAVCSSSSTKNPTREGLNPMLSSFDFFSNEEYLDGDKTAISAAFRQFLEEQNKKANARENGKNADANDVDMEQGKVNGKASATTSDSVSRKYKEDNDGEVSLNSFLKASPFLSADGEEEEEMIIKPHSKSLHKHWHNGDESSKAKIKVTHSARELFDECFSKWQNMAYSQVENSDLDAMAEDIYLSRKQAKTAAIAAALTKRELAGKCEELSPDMSGKATKMAKSPSIPSPTPPPRRNPDKELRGEDSPFMSSRKQEAKLNIRMDFLGDSLMSSDILAEERQLSQDLVQSSKKDQEFRSIFQHVQAAQLQRSPSELFAQHIVTIVHHIKAQHFPSSGMTLNERFTVYQRRAAEKEMMKPRKSPEIHRRIDVSPRAFKKHSQLFEAMKSSEDGTYKDGGEKMKGDPMDLRLDIERRKKYHDRDYIQDRGRDAGDSPDSSRERSMEKLSKCHDRSKKSKKKRSRSSSSSSSSSCKSQKEDLPDPKDKGFNKAQLGRTESPAPVERGRPRGGFQVRIRGRSWNRCSYQGNGSHSNTMANMTLQPKSEDWDPEFTPKSRKYYLHDDREQEAECKWVDNRGRGRGSFSRGRARFIIRKATGGPNTYSPKWAHDKFHINGEQGDVQEEETEQDHKEGEINVENT